jgi:general secretion pathway protein G
VDISPDRHRTGALKPDHSNGSANYLFADGHVDSIRAITIKQKIERGENPAQPPE